MCFLVPQILQRVEAMPTDKAVQFVKAHVVPASYPSVRARRRGRRLLSLRGPCQLCWRMQLDMLQGGALSCHFASLAVAVPQVSSLAFPNGRPTSGPDPKAEPPTVKNSLGQAMDVIYDWSELRRRACTVCSV